MGISGMKGLYFKPYKVNSFWFMRDLPVVWVNRQAAGPWRHSRPSSVSVTERCRSGASGSEDSVPDPTPGGSLQHWRPYPEDARHTRWFRNGTRSDPHDSDPSGHSAGTPL